MAQMRLSSSKLMKWLGVWKAVSKMTSNNPTFWDSNPCVDWTYSLVKNEIWQNGRSLVAWGHKKAVALLWGVSHSLSDHSPVGSQLPVRQLYRRPRWGTEIRKQATRWVTLEGDLLILLLFPTAEFPHEITALSGTLPATSWQILSQRHSPKLDLQHWPTETVREETWVGLSHQVFKLFIT